MYKAFSEVSKVFQFAVTLDVSVKSNSPPVVSVFDPIRDQPRNSEDQDSGTNTESTAQDMVVAAVKMQLKAAKEDGCEGLMLKTLQGENSTYTPNVRSEQWCKLKLDYLEGDETLVDTLDLVPIAGWHGTGRKSGWISPFLLAVYDPLTEQYQSLCKVMSGHTDKEYAELTEFYADKHLPKQPPYYSVAESLKPDFWFEAVQVWEIQGSELTLSPVHAAGMGAIDDEKGFSLRFPRFLRQRTDKDVTQTTTPEQLVTFYNNQERKITAAPKQTGNAGSDTEED
eukprot:TRINITY_DN33638_c0_g1_i1.p1 TRINITY_DN33638_c0_g1~~TRINITY_DN33638_c0_g1_i1.p1  ORF type:complete len:298 (+),score=23.79 TRINITY_DN33638_c0_g1_i1:46-894(+)